MRQVAGVCGKRLMLEVSNLLNTFKLLCNPFDQILTDLLEQWNWNGVALSRWIGELDDRPEYPAVVVDVSEQRAIVAGVIITDSDELVEQRELHGDG